MYVVKLLPKRLTRAEHTVADCKDKLTKLMLNSPSMSRCNYYDVLMHLAIQDHLYICLLLFTTAPFDMDDIQQWIYQEKNELSRMFSPCNYYSNLVIPCLFTICMLCCLLCCGIAD